ncbi:UNVERIFIED_CONTAM: hypothetical protein HDU68_001086 [Siphonaria sp. JEL0065]|nr:hypothetical protein HDU68_001086 [Siphonaria sp. JEL0065]
MIADWSSISDVPEIKQFFKTLVMAGYRFSQAAMSKISPQDLNRIRGNTVYSTMPAGRGILYVNPQYAIQQPFVAARPSITTVSRDERAKWVTHDVGLVENTVSMLVEAINFAEPGVDITTNEIAIESYNRCLEIQRRIVGHIEKVQEPDLLDQLITANTTIVNALELFNCSKQSSRVAVPNAAPATGGEGLLIDLSDSVQIPANNSAAPFTIGSEATYVIGGAKPVNLGSARPSAAPLPPTAPTNPPRGNTITTPQDPFADQ